MKVLTADQGNTLLKFSLFEEGREVKTASVRTDRPEEILPVVDEWGPDGGVFCSVGRFDIRFVETLRQLVDDRLLVLTPHTLLPIGVEYGSRETLGVDRLASACGASMLFPGERCAVADCGSAMTIDLLREDNCFAGGRIAPGLSMRIRSLHEYTARLPMISERGEVPVAGLTTETSLRSGILRGMAGELVSAAEEYGASWLVITGGDAPLLMALVEESKNFAKSDFKVELVPNLLNQGLLNIFNCNLTHERV